MYEYKATITNVVDGDTFDLSVDLGFHIFINIRARLLGADTPEKFGEEKRYGLIMKRYAEELLLFEDVIIKSEKDYSDVNTDSFGRWLVSIKTITDNLDLTSHYSELGVNKYVDNFNFSNVEKLAEGLTFIE